LEEQVAEPEATTMSWGTAFAAGVVATVTLVVITILFELISGGSLPS
jgi:hypothetical protein